MEPMNSKTTEPLLVVLATGLKHASKLILESVEGVSKVWVVSLTRSSCVSLVELTDGRGGEVWGRSQIIRRREILVLYKSLILAGYIVLVAFEHASNFMGWLTHRLDYCRYRESTCRSQTCPICPMPMQGSLADDSELKESSWATVSISKVRVNLLYTYCILTMNERRTCSK